MGTCTHTCHNQEQNQRFVFKLADQNILRIWNIHNEAGGKFYSLDQLAVNDGYIDTRNFIA